MPEQTLRGRRSLFRLLVGRRAGSTAPGQALAAIILLGGLFHLVWGTALELSNDEGYYYLYTTHLDLSFYDHPPMMAWVAKAGILLCGGWVHPFSVRLGFVWMFAGSTFVLARWTSRWFGDWAGVYAALLLNVSGYHAATGGFQLPDCPYMFFSLLTMWALGEALVAKPGQVRPWVWVGLAFGGALLSKYYAVFLPVAAVLYILDTPRARRLLLSPGPYLAVGIGLLLFSPVLAWNAMNGWASLGFQGGRAFGVQVHPEGLVGSVIGPVLYLLPWVWYLLAAALVSRLRRFRTLEGIDRLAVCLAVVPLVFFVVVSLFRWTLMHWALIGFTPMYPLAGAELARWAAAAPQRVRRFVTFMTAAVLVCAAGVLAQARFGAFQFPGKDPTNDISGWESVAGELSAHGLLGRPNTFLFTTQWYDSGQLAFATRERSPVLCLSPDGARGFGLWSKPEQWVGWDGDLVTTEEDDWEAEMLAPYFAEITKVAEFPMTHGGRAFRRVAVWHCARQTRPFLFNDQDAVTDIALRIADRRSHDRPHVADGRGTPRFGPEGLRVSSLPRAGNLR